MEVRDVAEIRGAEAQMRPLKRIIVDQAHIPTRSKIGGLEKPQRLRRSVKSRLANSSTSQSVKWPVRRRCVAAARRILALGPNRERRRPVRARLDEIAAEHRFGFAASPR